LGVPGGSTVRKGLQDFVARQEEELRKLLLEEVKVGEKTIVDVAMQDQLFAIWLRMRHAFVTGVARAKLRIMARVLNGQLENNCLSSDAFSQLAGVIEGLRFEEIAYLVTLHELGPLANEIEDRAERDKWLQSKIASRLIPQCCRDEESLEAVVTSVERTGLVIPPETITTESRRRRTSPTMAELVRIAKLDSQFFGT
jgi:hypothetical protein